MTARISLISLGCPKNTVDSELALGRLRASGCEITSDQDTADVLIVNTCGFKADAIEESVDTLLEAVRWKNRRSGRRVVAIGCLAQRHGAELAARIPELDAVLGIGAWTDLPEGVEHWLKDPGETLVRIGQPQPMAGGNGPRLLTTAPWTAYLRISDGCDYACAFCTIPSIRGPYVSRPTEDIVREAEVLAAQGVRELALIAQDTTRYGWDLYGELRLPVLLKALARVDGIRWVRVMYAHPSTVNDALIDVFAQEQKVLPYLDIPLQHSDREVLRAMNRPGDGARYLDLIRRLRAARTDFCVRSTFIVGHPGERPAAFAALKAFLNEADLDRVGVFAYSAEEGTPSAERLDRPAPRIAEKRREDLMRFQAAVSRRRNESLVDRVLDVLVEGRDGPVTGIGRSYRDAPDIDGIVSFHGAGEFQPGDIVPVRVTSATTHDLCGEVVTRQTPD